MSNRIVLFSLPILAVFAGLYLMRSLWENGSRGELSESHVVFAEKEIASERGANLPRNSPMREGHDDLAPNLPQESRPSEVSREQDSPPGVSVDHAAMHQKLRSKRAANPPDSRSAAWIDEILHSEDPQVRSGAIKKLTAGPLIPQARQAVYAALQDNDENVRLTALGVLPTFGDWRDPDIMTRIEALAEKDPSSVVRSRAALLLEAQADKAAASF